MIHALELKLRPFKVRPYVCIGKPCLQIGYFQVTPPCFNDADAASVLFSESNS